MTKKSAKQIPAASSDAELQAEEAAGRNAMAAGQDESKAGAVNVAETELPGVKFLRYAGIGARHDTPSLTGEAITSLGSLEAEILGLLWGIGQPASCMDVLERSLYQRRARGEEPIGFSTINTTMRRLAAKGVLQAHKGEQRLVLYTPTVSCEDMAARILNNVSRTLLGKTLHDLLPRLVGRPRAQLPENASSTSTEDGQIQRLLKALEAAAGETPVE